MQSNKLVLHNDQMAAIQAARSSFSTHQSIIICAPTGFGKSFVAAYMAKSALEKSRSSLFVVHRQELAYQLKETFDFYGIDCGILCGGSKFEPDKKIQIAMVGEAKKRFADILPNLVVFDEAHHAVAKTWRDIVDMSKSIGAKICGLTATPVRLSGEGLRDCFSDIVYGTSVARLIKMGRLSEYEIFAPDMFPDLSSAKTSRGDYAACDVEKAMNKPSITGNAVEQYKQLCDGKAALVFCSTVKHSEDVAAEFNAAGYKFISLNGNTPNAERMSANENLRTGKIHGITNCSIYTEGVSVDRVECVILLRPTKSLTVYLQSVGRGLRKFIGKEKLTIIDAVGACYIHGLPCDEREWSLDGKKKNRTADEKPMALKHCAKCKAIYGAKHMCCPRCGAVQLIAHKELEIKKGTLKAVTKEDIEAVHAARRQRKTEEWQADTYEKLVALGVKRGYDNPKYWAKLKTEIRSKRNGNKKTNG